VSDIISWVIWVEALEVSCNARAWCGCGWRGKRMHLFNEPARWMAVSLTSDGLISSLSSSAEHIIGYSSCELVGRPVSAILGERSVFEIAQMMKSALDWGVWEGELVLRDRSGRLIRARAALAQLTSYRNDCAGFMLLSEMGPGEASSEALGPLRDVGAHLRQISHELNNPLAVLMGFSQLILLDPHCEGKMRTDVERLFTETKRIIQIVERLHTYALSLQEKQPEMEQVRVTS
jgi:PAS domain S-box-containing protein